ncbi:MAG: hypothetical protein NT132_03925 [Microbacterium sp.]|uniref:hypothetical protein n=1 Tax=Microbacterium sp. TaxID=51671 RepID=UPI002613C75E|nr:hypothetical protein [Microbacterium sp.]MCX6501547.1 hypothetical protein [Microbacterium sp.]
MSTSRSTGSRSHRRRRSRPRIPRQGIHWSLYVGVILLAAGVMALALAAVITH